MCSVVNKTPRWRTRFGGHSSSSRAHCASSDAKRGVSYTLLCLIRDGERTATPRTVEAVAEALERIASQLDEAARVSREALEEGGSNG